MDYHVQLRSLVHFNLQHSALTFKYSRPKPGFLHKKDSSTRINATPPFKRSPKSCKKLNLTSRSLPQACTICATFWTLFSRPEKRRARRALVTGRTSRNQAHLRRERKTMGGRRAGGGMARAGGGAVSTTTLSQAMSQRQEKNEWERNGHAPTYLLPRSIFERKEE
jgi:hypothetical protein